jgi:cold shock CspA family protein/ribosome-associated translation inhibitor RaiA
MEAMPEVEDTIREKAALLDTFASNITSCRFVIEPSGKHRQHGGQFHAHIDVTLPGGEIVSTHEPDAHKEYKDLHIAIRDAFNAVVRQLEDYVRVHRGDVKRRSGSPHGRVTKLLKEQGYGFLTTSDRREIYFHRNSVLNNAFDRLEVGTEVAFAEEQGDSGPQASTVHLVGRHGGA